MIFSHNAFTSRILSWFNDNVINATWALAGKGDVIVPTARRPAFSHRQLQIVHYLTC